MEGAHSHIRYKVESAITLAPSACFNRRLTVAAWALKCTVLRYKLNVVLRRLMLYVVTEVCVAAMVWLARLDEPLLHRIEETRVSAADIPPFPGISPSRNRQGTMSSLSLHLAYVEGRLRPLSWDPEDPHDLLPRAPRLLAPRVPAVRSEYPGALDDVAEVPSWGCRASRALARIPAN